MDQDLVTVAPAGTVLALLEDDIEAAVEFSTQEKAAATRRAYDSDWRIFQAYCQARGLESLPASPQTVAAFVAAEAKGGAKASTIGRRVAAIGHAHKLAGIDEKEIPTKSEAVKGTVRGIRRSIGAAKVQKAPATADLVRAMLDSCPDDLRGKRDRAIMAIGFAGAFRRSEIVALTVADIAEIPDGLRIMIRHSKGDQESVGQEIAIPRGAKLRPVEALKDWLTASGITAGPVFRAISRGNRLRAGALGADSVADIVKAYCLKTGLDPEAFAAHSLRAGFLTSGAEAGASIFKLMEVSRHKSVDTLRGYIRRADLFKDHAGASFL